jgi:DNA repair protein RecN (Recombination protein N)
MLLQLNIKNFALIESLTINFEQGLNILTGETGAGKSILIDAINYVLGNKFNKGLIRTGEEKTFVEAIFDIRNSETINILKSMEIDFEDILIISRETFKSGKSIVKINNKSLLLTDVKRLSNTLINIHGQHENQQLLNPSTHIHYLDKFGDVKLEDQIHRYRLNFKKVVEIDNQIRKLGVNDGEKEKLVDFLKYQIDEINNGKLKLGEDIELEQRYEILTNSEKINSCLISSYNILYNSDDDFVSVYDLLNKAIKELKLVENHMDKLTNIISSLEESYFNVQQNIVEIRNLQETVIYDKEELEFINSRIFLIDSLKRKYGKTIEEVLEYKDKITTQYNELIDSSKIIEELRSQREEVVKQMSEEADIIHNLRCNIGKVLESKIKHELNYVGLEKSIIKIDVSLETEFYSNGRDKVQFMISTNPGEPVKPLDKVVSGGELSRIMLSIKAVFVDKDEIPSVIFDEIDIGISGRIAQSVAEKMYLISNMHQVFCVTHLPQIASMSDNHFLVSKEIKFEKTYTNIKKIDILEKEYEIARMIGGSKITELTLQHSREMIGLAIDRKKDLIFN